MTGVGPSFGSSLVMVERRIRFAKAAVAVQSGPWVERKVSEVAGPAALAVHKAAVAHTVPEEVAAVFHKEPAAVAVGAGAGAVFVVDTQNC